MIPDLSLNGIKNYVETTKTGVHNPTHPSGHFRDLEALVNEMCQVRSGSSTSLACGCHGNQLQSGYDKTTCGSHSRSNYGKITISLAELSEVIESLPACSCNANAVYGCICETNCDCNCDYCSCNCDYSST